MESILVISPSSLKDSFVVIVFMFADLLSRLFSSFADLQHQITSEFIIYGASHIL